MADDEREMVETPVKRILPRHRLMTIEGVADKGLEAFRVTYVAEEPSRERVLTRGLRAILATYAQLYPRYRGKSPRELEAIDSDAPRVRVAYLADVTEDDQYYFCLWRLPSPRSTHGYVESDRIKARIELLMWGRILTMLEAHRE